jgi:hypothetical protein
VGQEGNTGGSISRVGYCGLKWAIVAVQGVPACPPACLVDFTWL